MFLKILVITRGNWDLPRITKNNQSIHLFSFWDHQNTTNNNDISHTNMEAATNLTICVTTSNIWTGLKVTTRFTW